MNSSKQIPTGRAVRCLDLGRQCRLWLLALASLFFLHTSVWAEIAANTSFVSGVVTATASAKPARELAKGHDIFSGDTIDTAENGRIQMRFTDGGLVSLMPRTTFSVDEYLHEGKAAEDGSLVFGMLRGGMRTITGSIGKIKHDQYELKTPVATLGIRGTEYIAVLNPPNTLRVHVGKGKVVITNEQGTLEVPEGRNAVVTLGSAPEFSDQGPQYLAAGIGGDRASLEGLIDQDPYGVDVTLDTPWVFDEERRLASNPPAGVTTPPPGGGTTPPGGGTTPPGGGTTPPGGGTNPAPGLPTDPLVDGPGYQIAGFEPTDGYYQYSDPATFEVKFDSLGAVTDFGTPGSGPSTFEIGTLQATNVGTYENISWGQFTSGSGYLGSGVADTAFGSLPYVIGSVVPDPTVLAGGTLNYTLVDGTPTHDGGTLNKFDLSIVVDSLAYNFDMELYANSITYEAIDGGTLGGSLTHFQFGTSNITGMSGSTDYCSGSMGNGCTVNIRGLLAGDNAEQAGILYQLDGYNETYTGAAGLKQ